MYYRPEETFSREYFPIHLQMNAQIKLKEATLNLSGVEFIEHYFQRVKKFSVFETSQSTLIFNVTKKIGISLMHNRIFNLKI